MNSFFVILLTVTIGYAVMHEREAQRQRKLEIAAQVSNRAPAGISAAKLDVATSPSK